MDALLGTIGTLGLLVGIILIVLGKIKKKKYRGGLISIISLALLIAGLSMDSGSEKVEGQPEITKTKTEQTKKITWEEKVKEAATLDGNETDRASEIEKFAMDYEPTTEEIAEFEKYIIEEFKNGNYIADISNDEYMLENIFKSLVVERHYNKGEPMKDFAFDFYQNSKYTYRGVDAPDSTPVKSNEDQMKKNLKKME